MHILTFGLTIFVLAGIVSSTTIFSKNPEYEETTTYPENVETEDFQDSSIITTNNPEIEDFQTIETTEFPKNSPIIYSESENAEISETTATTSPVKQHSSSHLINTLRNTEESLNSVNDDSGIETKAQNSSEKIKKKLPFGSWKSPVNSKMATAVENDIAGPPVLDPVTGRILWIESIEGGNRNAIFQYDPETEKISQWINEADVRSGVHEYGGQPFVIYNNTAFFSSSKQNGILHQTGPIGTMEHLTNKANKRYGDGTYAPKIDTLFWVVEDHTKVKTGADKEPKNTIVAMDPKTGEEITILDHTDFFANPRVSKDASEIVWIEWKHPAMPWDETKMVVSSLPYNINEMEITRYFQLGSIMMPKWTVDNELLYINDLSGWWNLYILNKRGFEINLTNKSEEVGWPVWWIGEQAFDVHPFQGFHEAIAIAGEHLYRINTRNGKQEKLETPYDSYLHGITYSKDGNKVYVFAANGTRKPELIEVDLRGKGGVKIIRESINPIEETYISIPKHIRFPTTDNQYAFGYVYYPLNAEYDAPDDESKPPLIVRVHGGPTGAATSYLNPLYQFFTSRGFAILDVNYRGSSGYGKEYREKIYEKWGVVDVADVQAGAKYLVSKGIVDEERLGISGISSGAFTALSSLILNDTFKAGVFRFGIADLNNLAMETHKFESRYIHNLVGKLPEHEDRYNARSPINHVEKLNSPLMFLSGAKDQIVPLHQSEEMYQIAKSKGLPTAHIIFPDEAHGFRHSKNAKTAIEAEIVFYSKVFGIDLSDVTSDVKIENIETWLNSTSEEPVTEGFIH